MLSYNEILCDRRCSLNYHLSITVMIVDTITANRDPYIEQTQKKIDLCKSKQEK